MKAIQFTSVITLLSAFVLTACQSTPTSPTTSHVVVTAPSEVKETYPVLPPAQGMIRLIEGQTVVLEDTPLTLTFNKVLSDSRCPTDVKCIWAGNATIAIIVTPTNGVSKTVNLSTGDLRGELIRKANVAGHDISLETLYPTPTATVGIDKLSGKYLVDLKVVTTTQ